MTTPTERQEILTDLSTLAIRDLVAVWRQGSRVDVDFRAFILDAFPEIATAYSGVAAELAADWYVATAPDVAFTPVVAAAPSVEVLTKSAQWALGAEGEVALDRMSGTVQRSVFDGARETTLINVAREPGSRWVRHAQPGACAFCRMMASRHKNPRTWYRSERSALDVVGRSANLTSSDRRQLAAGADRDEILAHRSRGRVGQQRGNRAVGSTGYHDYCRCIAVEVRVGQEYEPPEYVQQWDDEYQKARANAGTGDPKAILAAWRQQGVK